MRRGGGEGGEKGRDESGMKGGRRKVEGGIVPGCTMLQAQICPTQRSDRSEKSKCTFTSLRWLSYLVIFLNELVQGQGQVLLMQKLERGLREGVGRKRREQ